MAVMDIRVVWVFVDDRLMPVTMAVRLAVVPAKIMFVLVMIDAGSLV